MLLDLHCHIYKDYDLHRSLDSVLRLRPELFKLLFLTERSDCQFFENFANQAQILGGLRVSKLSQNLILIEQKVLIIRARQYASVEGIEVLSFFAAPSLNDGLPAADYCQAIIEQNGVIGFSWAFGKWRSFRSNLIKTLALKFGNDHVLLLDSRLRPWFLALPNTFKDLAIRGFSVLAGSDPLPLVAHQDKLCSFGVESAEEFELKNLSEMSIRELLFSKNLKIFGGHVGAVSFVRDQISLRLK